MAKDRPPQKKGSLLSKYTDPASDESSARSGEEPSRSEETAPSTSGGLTASPDAAPAMLDYRFRDGRRHALPYSYLAGVALTAERAIVCEYPNRTVTITGRNLGPVYAAITRHTAVAVAEDPTGFDEGGDEPYVERVDIASDQAAS